jgi:hypothetical protein
MAMDKINRKLDLIMEKLGIDASEFKPKPAPPARKLSAADQQAIDNAPKTPTGTSGPAGTGPRVDANNAPTTASSVPSVPADAVGSVTVETEQPDGDVTVETMDADAAKGNKPGGKPGKSERVNWNS